MSASLAARRAHLLLDRDLIDAEGGGSLLLLGTPMAAAPEDDPASAPLVTVPLSAPSFSVHATDASMVLVPAQGFASASGVVTWARFVNGAGVAVRDCPAGPPGSGAAVIVDDGQAEPSAQVYTGGEVNVTATFSRP